MLQKKVCVIVSGAKGRGRRIVKKFAEKGYRIAFMDIDKESGDSLRKEVEEKYGVKVFFFHGNVNSEEDRELFAGAVRAQYKKIDCLYYRSDIKNGRKEETEVENLLKGNMKRGSIVKDYI